MNQKSVNALSDITVFNKYAKFIPELGRRETWPEIVMRNLHMHQDRFPELASEIGRVYENYVITKRVLPSMRSLQFGGRPIELSHSRIFNCSYMPAESHKFFSELMFLLLGGTGVGYSVQKRHVDRLPSIKAPKSDGVHRFQIQDSIIGWADTVKVVAKAFFHGGTLPAFDYRDIRDKGTELVTTGGKAPGPEPLKLCVERLIGLFRQAVGRKLTPLEVHDMACAIADSVRAGGIRRAAMICLFDRKDQDMLRCKAVVPTVVTHLAGVRPEDNGMAEMTFIDVYGQTAKAMVSEYDRKTWADTGCLPWYLVAPARGRANNSAVLVRNEVSEEEFTQIMGMVEASGCGEPGVYWTNNPDWGTNPCCLAGNTKILTAQGYVPINSLDNGQEHTFINVAGEAVQGTVWATGKKKVLRIKAGRTTDPIEIRSTADHRFMTVDGSTVEAGALKGKSLMPFYSLKDIPSNLIVKYGFVFGDGSFRKASEQFKNAEASFTPGKDDGVKALFARTGWTDNAQTFTVDVSYAELQAFGIDTSKRTYERKLPEIEDLEELQDFMTGLYSANGCVIKGSRVAFKTTSPDVRDGLMTWLQRIGIQGAYITTNKPSKIAWSNGEYISKESYDVNIGQLQDVILFAQKVSFIQAYKQQALEALIRNKAPYVFSVVEEGVEPVYDFNLQDDTHWGVVHGVIAHNCEIALRPYQMCNLTEINAGCIESQEELNAAARAASFLGTLQASYTDFHYLNPKWREACEKDALLGVSMTGIASGKLSQLDQVKAAEHAKKVNVELAKRLGINPAARITCVKPAGTTSLVLGTSSGIHAWHAPYYIRRMRAGKDEELAIYMGKVAPALVEEDVTDPKQVVLSFPQKAPEGAAMRDESIFTLLERVKDVSVNWVAAGHVNGDNQHNVSCTISVKEGEWEALTKWMWDNREHYNGISVLPYWGSTAYPQMPFEDCTKEQYEAMLPHLKAIDITQVFEANGDKVDLQAEAACAGGQCEVTFG